MNSNKSRQRTELKAARGKLSKVIVEELSQQIVDRLMNQIDWSKIQNLHVYLPIMSNNEVNTWPLMKRLWKLESVIGVYTSVYGASRAMQHLRIGPDTEYEDDTLGIPTPITGFTQEAQDYDLIIVPTLGFDEQLNRLGYGRGVYDTFLKTQSGAKTIGLAYEISKLVSIKNETHDEKLNGVITEVKLYN